MTKPNRDSIRAFIGAQKAESFSCPEVGCTSQEAPKDYVPDRNRVKLGHGLESFERAKNAIKQWKMFDMPWITLCWPDVPIETGATIAVLVSHLGFWSLNACRIVYVIEEHGALARYGFAYPYTRSLQKRFARDSKIAMQRSASVVGA